jgi:hypothetical protein
MRIRAIIAAALLLLAGIVAAQDDRGSDGLLDYGDAVTGRITNEQFEVFYNFQGVADELLILEVVTTNDDEEFDWPEVTLYDTDRQPIADSHEFISINRSVIATILPYTGKYQITVSRDDWAEGEGEGDYMLRVIEPTTLRPGETVEDNARNDDRVNFYTIREDAFFSFYYEFSGGELDPDIQAYRVDPDSGELVPIATLRGNELRSGSIGMDGRSAALYVVTVGDNPFSFYFDDRIETVEYLIRLIVNE